MVLIKKGAYVLDQKNVREEQLAKKKEEAANAVIGALNATATTPAPTAPATPQVTIPNQVQPSVDPRSHTMYDPEAIRAALGRYIS